MDSENKLDREVRRLLKQYKVSKGLLESALEIAREHGIPLLKFSLQMYGKEFSENFHNLIFEGTKIHKNEGLLYEFFNLIRKYPEDSIRKLIEEHGDDFYFNTEKLLVPKSVVDRERFSMLYGEEVLEGAYKCKRCGSTNTLATEKATSIKADEIMSTIIKCMDCGFQS